MSDENQHGIKEGIPLEPPRWRKDLPTEWARDNYTTRREFTKFVVLTSGATFVGNGYFVVQKLREERHSYPELTVAGVNELSNGDVKLFRYPTENDPAILLRLANGDHVAYVQRCTHLSCPVYLDASSGRLECPCHNGAFDPATGEVLEGPPPRPLPRIQLSIRDGQIIAQGIQQT